MKSNHFLIISLALLIAGCSASSSTTDSNGKASKNEKKDASFEKMVTLIESGNYEFTAQSASPMGGKTVQITSSYILTAKDGNLKAYLPYFGRAYNASYGGDGGIDFDGEPSDFLVTKNPDKRNISIAFKIKNKDESYDCNLLVGYGGSGSLSVGSSKRQAISYQGQVTGPTPEKE